MMTYFLLLFLFLLLFILFFSMSLKIVTLPFFMQFASNLVCESLVAYILGIYINVDIFPPPLPLSPPPPLLPRTIL